MNKIAAFLLLLSSITAVAQPDKPAITAIGKPTGAKVESKIDKKGGTILSADRKVELIIPQGALSKKTTISIQSVDNLAPNGNGKAYRLEPSGIRFEQPLQLIFHYNEDESADSMQLLLGIAMQDNSGQWYTLKKITLDTVAKTISGSINHFSVWTKFDALKIYPEYARVKVGKKIDLVIDAVENEEQDLMSLSKTNDEVTPLLPKKYRAVWTATAGTIDVHSSNDVTYKAPATVPSQNPVAVSAKMQGVSFKYQGVSFNSMRLVSNILVYDNAYEVKMIFSIENADAGSQLGKTTYKDTGSFVVSLETGRARIIEKINKNTNDEYDYKGRCTIQHIGPNSGNIHITGVRSINVIPPASTGGRPTIDINFIYAPVRISLLRITCPPPPGTSGGPTTITTSPPPMVAAIPAYPMQIRFEAKEEEQILQKIGEEGSELYLKITVKQIKEEE